jgi:hypothetical protein
MPEVHYHVDRNVAVVTFSNPPVNGLSHSLRTGIADALSRARADDSVRAVVLTGGDGRFSGGADIREFGTPASTADPTLRQLIQLIETSAKPVVAAIAGTCLGGGLELAMAAHYRVATADAKLGLPEVKLGLLPGAGGTQRLPRLVGVARAIEMIVGGEPVRASELAGGRLPTGSWTAIRSPRPWRSGPSRIRRSRELVTSRSTRLASPCCARRRGRSCARNGPCCLHRCAPWTRSKQRLDPSTMG